MYCRTRQRTGQPADVRADDCPRFSVERNHLQAPPSLFNEHKDVWDAEYTELYDHYAPVLDKAVCQQVARENSEAWRSLLERRDNTILTTRQSLRNPVRQATGQPRQRLRTARPGSGRPVRTRLERGQQYA